MGVEVEEGEEEEKEEELFRVEKDLSENFNLARTLLHNLV